MSLGVVLAWAALVAAPSAALANPPSAPLAAPKGAVSERLSVPVIRQARERCGPAALEMVMHYYGAGVLADSAAEAAYRPVLRGALITDLAAAARSAGFDAGVETPSPDSLRSLLAHGVPPILLVDAGIGPLQKGHYVVLVEWDHARDRVTIHDGGSRPRVMARAKLIERWRVAGGQALVVRR